MHLQIYCALIKHKRLKLNLVNYYFNVLTVSLLFLNEPMQEQNYCALTKTENAPYVILSTITLMF